MLRTTGELLGQDGPWVCWGQGEWSRMGTTEKVAQFDFDRQVGVARVGG